ncbi:MAG TPA: MBL fold metallo-hydrolase [Acidimicrobiales bacterium]|nr:MBL fold metallo-hydrolase [Acidimicrobiales bacterium]
MASVVTIETPELGDRSYLISDGRAAVVVDPQRDIDRVLATAEEAGVRVALVAETHLHNDYVSGGRELAERTGAEHVIGGGEEVAFPCRPAVEGEAATVGLLTVRVLATPGHTTGHVSFVVEEDGRPVAVFTGGSLLYGTVGRTDLVSPERTDDLTRAQYHSAHRLASELPDGVTVHPTHGFGSFCSSTSAGQSTTSTIGSERQTNLALKVEDEDTFVKTLVAGLTAYPRYYAHMGPINRSGPEPLDLSPPRPVDPAELRRRIDAGEWVVDLRQRRAFAASHVAGTVSVELGTLFSTYLGWTIPWGTPLTLVGDDRESVAKAQRDLSRIGIDRLAGMAIGPPDQLAQGKVGSFVVADFAQLAEVRGDGRRPVVLDVRQDDEWEAGHLSGAVHVPFQELPDRLGELPDDELWVHCASGFRASIAASLLDRAGREVVLVDDDWERAGQLGLPVE